MFVSTAAAAHLTTVEADIAQWDTAQPGWEDSERWGDTLLSESDVAAEVFEPVSDDDWAAFLEMTFVDGAERDIA